MIIAGAVLFSMAGGATAIPFLYDEEYGVTNEQLAEFVESGVIFEDVMSSWLFIVSPLITDITPLSELTNLSVLALDCKADDLTPLAGLTDLISLSLYNLQADDLTPLTGLTNLYGLGLRDMQINDLTPLKGMTKMYMLWLEDSQISDITPLKEIKTLRFLSLMGSTVSREQVVELSEALPICRILTDYGQVVPGKGLVERTIFDALEILKYLVGVESDVVLDSDMVFSASMDGADLGGLFGTDTNGVNPAYLITPESKAIGEPTIFDALEVLKSLVGMPNLIDNL